jgi:hypothetical protein
VKEIYKILLIHNVPQFTAVIFVRDKVYELNDDEIREAPTVQALAWLDLQGELLLYEKV